MSTLRLSELGSDPESVLRLVRFFDDLDPTGVDAVLEAAQVVAGCPVHVRWDGSAPEVWLERDAPAHPLDGVLLDRVRHTLGTISARVPPSFGDPALVEVVLSSRERPEDRARAIRLLGLDESREVRVLAVSAQSSPEALRVITSALTSVSASVSVRTADLGTATAVVCQGRTNTRALSDELDQAIVTAFPAPLPEGADRGPWVGLGAAGGVFAAPTSWGQALRALRFASSTGFGRRAVAYERLSALELLAELPPDATRRSHALTRINEIAATPAGRVQVETAEAFCVFGSLRRTAEELHVHHSTVAARLAHIESQLGWDMDDPLDRFSATLVLMIRRITLSSAELTD
ncbi:CdaR family transcriptional regulator [Mycolicibacterium sp. CBMA 226]|uniref:PucR family transcriptional regulator n=1 Tax=Mycolicibacterium sp. CBMA 226 TaxID=2606611 RepID=UPI001309E272|nr:helix-turn-helix domain-containing protein [Mycolicibacterium sp. CBMA 226]MUL76101.1 PucR family transcriptional regulator [Mycolicibacterium sp. CBMA 226]